MQGSSMMDCFTCTLIHPSEMEELLKTNNKTKIKKREFLI